MDQVESNDLVVKPRAEKVSFDDVLKELGEFGRYQKMVYFLCCLPYVFLAMLLIGWVFVGANVNFMCRKKLDDSNDEVFVVSNLTNVCHLPEEDGGSKCPHGYIYDRSEIGDSVTIEFDLVCDHKELHATIGASPMFGYLFGGFIFGHVADKVGRKPTLLIANIFLIIGGFWGALATNYWSFVASRVVVGFAIPGVDLACFIMGMELVGKSKRTLAGILCWFFETSGYLAALALALLINSNWRLLLAIYTLPSLFVFTYKFIVPESPRWLVSQGRSEEAIEILKTTAKVNKVQLTQELLILATLTEDEQTFSSETYSIMVLFRYKNMRCKTLILMCTWLICPAMYYILLLDQTELSENRFIGFLMTTLVQLPGYIFVLATLERPEFGRKKSLVAFLIITGICLFCHPLVPATSKYWGYLQVCISILGRFCANCSYTVLGLYSSELFPTVVRSTGMGFTIVVSRVGTILAPYLLLLNNYAPLVLGVSSFTAGTLALMLPETLGQGLPETIEDGEKIELVYPTFLSRKGR